MKKPPIPNLELERLKELETYQLIGIAEEDDFDFITSMAAQICGTKISLISLVTEDKQWFLSHHGLETRETPRDYSFCAHAINHPDQVFIVQDARKDNHFRDNPLTTGDPNVVFYAGVPLVSPNGLPLGSLCVIDDTPKNLQPDQIQQLKKLANQTLKLFELRRSQIELKKTNETLRKNIELLQATQKANQLGTWELEIATGKTTWSEMVYRIHEVPKGFDHNQVNAIEFYHPDYRSIITNALEKCISENKAFDIECLLISAKGKQKWVRSTGRKIGKKVVGSFQDISQIKESELKFKGIFNSTFSFIGFLDTDGILLEANDTAINMAGITHEDVIGKPYWNCYWWQISEETQKELKLNFQKALSGESVAYEVVVWIADKTPITILFSLKPIFDERGKVIFVVPEGMPVQDIVDTRNRYRAVIDGTKAGTFEWNIETNEVLINHRFAEMLGYTLEELEPVTFEKWLSNAHHEDLEQAQNLIEKCFKKESNFFELEMRLVPKTGDWVWVNVRGKIFDWSPSGRALKMYGTLQEITERKSIEFRLLEERALLRTIIDSTPDSIYVKDLQGRKLMANKAACNYCGVAGEDELIGKTDYDFYPNEITKNTHEVEQKVLVDGESILNQEGIINGPDGEEICLLTSKIPLYDQAGKISGLVGIGRNITKRKKAEDELLHNKNLLEALFDLSPIGIALNDFTTGRFLDVNDKLVEPTGYTKEEFLALSYWDVTPRSFESEEAEAVREMQEKGSYDQFEKEYIRKDGSRYPVALQGVVIEDSKGQKLIWSFVRDVSKEKNAERKLREAISNLQALLDASQQVAIIATDTQGMITQFNSGAERMLGYKSNELVGLHSPQLIHLLEESERESQHLSEKYQNKITGFETFIIEARMGLPVTKEWTYLRKDGNTLPVLLSVNAIADEGEIIGYLGVATDISALKKVEKEIKSLLAITKEQNERLKNFAHIVSHNLRSHSGGISGLFELIKIEYPEIASNELIALIIEGTENLQKTVEDLTEVVRVNLATSENSKIWLHDIVKKNITSLNLQIKQADIEIINTMDPNLQVKGMQAYFDSIVLNMITNAIKYRSEERASFLKIYSKSFDEHVTLYFEDNGLGIDLKKYGDKLFGMYKTFHHHHDSRGVGLFITKNQIESMGGKIEIESEVNVGTTFKISFPL